MRGRRGAVSIAHDITKQKRTEIRREFAHQELQMVLDRFDVLRRILRVCRVCEKIRDREGNWSSLHEYLVASVDADETNDYCPACVKEVRPGPR